MFSALSLNRLQKILLSGVSLAVIVGVLFFFYGTALANVLWDRYLYSEAAPFLPEAALFFDRTDAALAMQIGYYYFGNGAYVPVRAEQAYTKAVAIQPTITLGYYQLARVLFVESKFDAALKAIDLQLQNDPTNLRALYIRGLINAYNNNFPAAVSDFTRFVAWAPTEWAGYNDLAWVLGEEKQYTQGEQVLTEAFAKATGASENPWLWDNIGVQQLNLGQYTQAVASFKEATKLAAALTPASWHRAYPGDNAVQSPQAIRQFQTAIELNLNQAEHDLASS